MQAVVWKWLGRFALAVVLLTVVLSLVAGAVLRHSHAPVPGWLGGILSLLAVVCVGGFMLPAMQRDVGAARDRGDKQSRP